MGCPDRGDETRADIVRVFEKLDLSAIWGETDVEYETSQRTSNGNPIIRFASVSMLSITYSDHCAEAAAKRSTSGARGSRQARRGRDSRGTDVSQRWVEKRR